MLFSSITFLGLFLPLTVGIYYILPKTLRNLFLLLASIFFYAWGDPRYLPIMFVTILINYFGALLISKFEQYNKHWLVITICANLSFLIYFKYFNFIIENINAAFKTNISLWNIALPLGISFYTFQALSYTIDVYQKVVPPQKSLYKLALYIVLFPQLIAGPIIKYHDIIDQIENRKETVKQIYYGIRRFVIGLAKKVLLANILGEVANKIDTQIITDNGVEVGIAWIGVFAGAMQIYYDFSGYSDMAIGIGAIFGFKFTENFNYPFVSKTISEYWRRWHISLGTWCKDYIYIPMGGGRVTAWRKYVNIIVVFFCVGIWHGATWMFIISGLYNGILVVFENIFGINKKQYGIIGNFIRHIYAFTAILFGLLLFRSETLDHTKKMITTMFGQAKNQDIIYGGSYYLDTVTIIVMCIAIVCCTPICRYMLDWGKKCQIIRVSIDFWLIILLFLSFMQIAISSYNPFIYFRF